ncbi:MAG TPA: hypothetical protein ENJ31_05830 [Anaerolineae bacterium]|nr:hypothetical protein [Anaerolineae bacterium]
MEESITIRLPSPLANRLREERMPPATVIRRALEEWLARQPARSEQERTWEALTGTGLLEPLDEEWAHWMDDGPDLDDGRVRQALRGVPPLSTLIVAERAQGR